MQIEFIVFFIISVISSLSLIFIKNIIRLIFCFLIFIISLSCIYFYLGMFFVGSLGIIVYSQSVIVMLILSSMLLGNLHNTSALKVRLLFRTISYIISKIILFILIYSVYYSSYKNIESFKCMDDKHFGVSMFKDYLIAVELSSIILLTTVVLILHFLTDNKKK